jgi:heat shock protein HspQ
MFTLFNKAILLTNKVLPNHAVVKHKVEGWRGVVVGWERIDCQAANEPQLPSSLTQKTYTLDPADCVKYTVILDSGDAHLHYSKRREASNLSMAEVRQSDLAEVEDERYEDLTDSTLQVAVSRLTRRGFCCSAYFGYAIHILQTISNVLIPPRNLLSQMK